MLKNVKKLFLCRIYLYIWHGIIYLSIVSQCLCLLLFCFEFCLLYRIFCEAEIKMAGLKTLKYLSCSVHGQPER